jgi:uncharacterized protein (TIGR02452 family)
MKSMTLLPPLDNGEMAAARRCELDIPRELAAALGRSALEAGRKGHYLTKDGRRVIWADAVQAAVRSKISIPPDLGLPTPIGKSFAESVVQVTNETTLGAARRLHDRGRRPLALNFANGIHPGGGFLIGAEAQEEVLCRSSALYHTLEGDAMYEAHSKRPRSDSTDWAILSRDVPVFRNDDGTPLETPWLLSFITCAAPYVPEVGQPEARGLLRRRIHRVLAIARTYGYTTLVLGAWGCGAFKNDPERTATDFRSALENEYRGAFREVVFAIADWSPERRFLGPFIEVFEAA